MKNLAFVSISLAALVAVSCNKNGEVPEPVSPVPVSAHLEAKKEVRKFSLFVDRHMKAAAMTKSINAQASFAEAVDAYMDENLSAEEAASVRDFVEGFKPQLEEHVALCDALPSLEEAETDQEAAAIIKNNFAVSTNPFGTIVTNTVAVNGALETLREDINAEIADDLVNAYLLDDGTMSEAQVENLYETTVATIKGKIATTIENFRIGTIAHPNGLTPQEVDMVGLSTLMALETINDDLLLDNVEEALEASLPDVAVDASLSEGEVATKGWGWFKKVGNFFKKVVRTVQIVKVYVQAVSQVVVGFIASPIAGVIAVGQAVREIYPRWRRDWIEMKHMWAYRSPVQVFV